MATDSTSPEVIQTHERRVRALDLRRNGASYRQISAALGVSASTAHEDVQVALRDSLAEPAEAVRKIMLERLDAMLLPLMRRATDPQLRDYQAVDRVLKILERQAALLGVDAPRRIDITGWLRAKALEDGLDPDLVVAGAEELIREHQL